MAVAADAEAGAGNATCTGPSGALVFPAGRLATVTDEVSAVYPHHCWTLTAPANTFVWVFAEAFAPGATLQLRMLTRNPVAAFPPPQEIEAHAAAVPVIPARVFSQATSLFVQVSRLDLTTGYRLHVVITSADVQTVSEVSALLRPPPSSGQPADLLLPYRIFGQVETSTTIPQHGLPVRSGERISLIADGRPARLDTGQRPATGVRPRLEVYAPDGAFVARFTAAHDRVAGTFTATVSGIYRLDLLNLSAPQGAVRLLAVRSELPAGATTTDVTVELPDATPQFDGGLTTHIYRVRNQGPATATGLQLEVPLFGYLFSTRATVGGQPLACGAGTGRAIRCPLPALAAGQAVDVAIVQDPADRDDQARSVRAWLILGAPGTTYDPRIENDAVSVTVLPWVRTSAAATVTDPRPGAPVTLTMQAVNDEPYTGGDQLIAAVVAYPAGLTPTTVPLGCLQESLSLRCVLTVRADGSPAPFALTFNTPGTLAPGTPLPFTVTLTSTHPDVILSADRSPGNDVARVTATVLAAPTLTDADGDTLSDLDEQSWGLDPLDANGPNGPHGDPDGDGRTNAEELAEGTHPRGTSSLFFAEGSTGAFFDERLALFNPDADAARVLVRYLRPAPAPPLSQRLVLPGLTRVTLDLDALAGLEDTAVSAIVEADRALVGDRTLSWDASGYGAHAETAVARPRSTWYFAEGSTVGPFNLFYLLQNPGASDATVQVRYLRPTPLAPVTRTYTVPASSRFNIWVDQEGAELASTDVSAIVESNVPLIAERAMYLDGAGLTFRAGHDAVGLAAPAPEWFLAEGATGPYFDLFVLLANPTTTDAEAEVSFLLPDGRVIVRSKVIAANSRSNIWVDLEAPELADTAVSTTVRSTNGVPLLVERAMWWPGDATSWHEAHASGGVTSAATRWALAEGETGGVRGAATYVLLANTAPSPQDVRVAMYPEGGTPMERIFRLLPRSRFNVDVAAEFPALSHKRFSTIVTATLPASLIVERAMYWDAGGVRWAAGTNAVATPVP